MIIVIIIIIKLLLSLLLLLLMSMIYLIHPNLVMTYSKYPKTYFNVFHILYYPLKSLVPRWLSFPRSPKDFQELLLGSAVYVGVGPGAGPKESPGSWVIATSREQPT
jgi:hypothetical protein